MTNTDRITLALELAKAGKLNEARGILLLANADERAWAKFGKYWRGEGR